MGNGVQLADIAAVVAGAWRGGGELPAPPSPARCFAVQGDRGPRCGCAGEAGGPAPSSALKIKYPEIKVAFVYKGVSKPAPKSYDPVSRCLKDPQVSKYGADPMM